MNPTRHGLRVPMLKSSTLRCKLCKSGMSPAHAEGMDLALAVAG